MTTDIVCGKEVEPKTAVLVTYGDRPFYFCSEKCANDFIGNPIRYTDTTGAVASTEGSPVLSAQGKIKRSSV